MRVYCQSGAKKELTVEKTWKPIAAGLLDIVGGTLGGLGSIIFIVTLISAVSPRMDRASPLSILIIVLLIIVPLATACLALAGGVCAMRRKRWRLAIAGAASVFLNLAIICHLFYLTDPLGWKRHEGLFDLEIIIAIHTIPILIGIAPMVLTALAKKEFE